MKYVVEYFDKALQFEQLAVLENDARLKASLLEQAQAYRKLAVERANREGLALPQRSN